MDNNVTAYPSRAINKLLQQEMLHRYRVQDHSQSALLLLTERLRSPSALQAIAALSAEEAELFNRVVRFTHRHYKIRELLRRLEGKHGADREDLHQDGVVTLLQVREQTTHSPGSVEFGKILFQAIKRDLLDRLRYLKRRSARHKWQYVHTIRVEPEEGFSSEDPSVNRVGLYFNPPSPLRDALLTDAASRLTAAAAAEQWKQKVLRDLFANADLCEYPDQNAGEYYKLSFGRHEVVPRTAVFNRHHVSRRLRDSLQRELGHALPPDERLALLDAHPAMGRSGAPHPGAE